MKKMLGVVSCVLVMTAVAEDYAWHSAADGFFQDAANWKVNNVPAENIPGIDDRILPVNGAYTITFQNDATIGSVFVNRCWSGSTPDDIVFDLGGNALTITNYFAIVGRQLAKSGGGNETTETGVTLQNGHFKFPESYYWKSGAPYSVEGCLKGGFSVNPGTNANSNREKITIAGEGTTFEIAGEMFFGSENCNINFLGGAYVTNDAYRIVRNNQRHVIAGEGTRLDVRDLLFFATSNTVFEIKDKAEVFLGGCNYVGQKESQAFRNSSLIVNDALLCTTDTCTLDGYYQNSKNAICFGDAGDNLLCATNNGRVQVGSINIICAKNSIIRAADDGEIVTAGGIALGQDNATGSTVELDNGKITVGGNMSFASSGSSSSNGVLRIKGARSCLKINGCAHIWYEWPLLQDTSLAISYGVKLEMDIPKDGFEQTPIQVPGGRIVVNGNEDNPNKLIINAQKWAVKNPKGTIDLITCSKSVKTAYESLIANATFIGGKASAGCVLSVSEDGKTLSLTAPSRMGTVVIVK